MLISLTSSTNCHHLLGFFTSTFFRLCGSSCLLISHIFAQDEECCWDKKKEETFFSCLVPPPRPPLFSPPLTQLSTLRRGEAKQTAVQTPQIITQESHWVRCVGEWLRLSGCTSVYWHSSPYVMTPANQKPRTWISALVLGGINTSRCLWLLHVPHLLSHLIRLYQHRHSSFTFSIR